MAAGDAVLWPPDVVHAAWTEHGPMRAFVVEFALGGDRADAAGILEGRGVRLVTGEAAGVARADGALRDDGPAAYDPAEGEPR